MICGFGIVAAIVLIACPATKPDTDATAQGSSSGQPTDSGMGGAGGMGGSSVVSSGMSTSTASGGGTGGEGGKVEPHPIDCAHLNPGITCVENDDCPPQSKPELDQCGRWICVVPLPLDAGTPGKCMLP